MIQEWYELKELLGISGLATTVQGITKKAKNENWQRRRVQGVKGKVFEYHYTSFPLAVQQALGLAINTTQPESTNAIRLKEKDELAKIPFYEVYASAGYGAINADVCKPDDYIGLSQHWLRMRGFPPNQIIFILASGDSMYPTISDNDMLLVNLGEKTPKDGKIYVLRQGEQIWVKRVQGILNGIRLISDNKDIYAPVDIIFDEGVDFEVIGRVVHIGHTLI